MATLRTRGDAIYVSACRRTMIIEPLPAALPVQCSVETDSHMTNMAALNVNAALISEVVTTYIDDHMMSVVTSGVTSSVNMVLCGTTGVVRCASVISLWQRNVETLCAVCTVSMVTPNKIMVVMIVTAPQLQNQNAEMLCVLCSVSMVS